jgi:hypothetical protein
MAAQRFVLRVRLGAVAPPAGAVCAVHAALGLAFALAGLPFFLATGGLVEAQRAGHLLPGWNLPLWIAYVYNCASWLWSFAFIGLFLRYLQRPAPGGWATWPTARTGCTCCTCR